jgi:transposase InsO family protein
VGWAIADHMRKELVIDALQMAVARRRPELGVVHHSDKGSQYTSLLFTQRCSAVGIEVSNGSRGDCFDNSAMESFHASLKKDLIHRRSWPTKTEARTAIFEYIETFYNRRRRHSRLGMLSPVDYENTAHTLPGISAATRRPAETSNINYNTPSTATKAA